MSTLKLAGPQAAAICRNSSGSSGQGDLMMVLSRDPLAIVERKKCPRHYDHVHLARFDGTDYVQWCGRAASGYHFDFGAIMEIVE